MEEKPYIEIERTITEKFYNPNYGDDKICKCGHTYYRHFDPYEEMESLGCKYCGCYEFEEDALGEFGIPISIIEKAFPKPAIFWNFNGENAVQICRTHNDVIALKKDGSRISFSTWDEKLTGLKWKINQWA